MEPIDVVYTWVDDSFAGYREVLNQYVADKRDTNPNRTRDNLDIIRYSMRSVARNLPQVRKIYFVSCRPQLPDWLDADHPRIEVVHHDQLMDASVLPTFNSFNIVSHLHLIPNVSKRFLYIEDDMLVMSPKALNAMFAPDGRAYMHFKPMRVVPREKLNPQTSSPWNLALANADAALSERYGPGPRRHVIHGPQVMDTEISAQMCRDYRDLIETTRQSRFRGGDNVPPEWLAPHLAVETGAAVAANWAVSKRVQGYVSLENLAPWTWWQLVRLAWRKPLTVTLNDSFEDAPNPKVEAMVRKRLQRWFPDPAPWEKPARD